MKIVKFVAVAALLAAPILASSDGARAATANQYSAAGHGKQPSMTRMPSRAIYHRGQNRHRMQRRHRGY